MNGACVLYGSLSLATDAASRLSVSMALLHVTYLTQYISIQ